MQLKPTSAPNQPDFRRLSGPRQDPPVDPTRDEYVPGQGPSPEETYRATHLQQSQFPSQLVNLMALTALAFGPAMVAGAAGLGTLPIGIALVAGIVTAATVQAELA